MEEHVSLQRSHEEQGGGLRIADAQPSGRRGTAEVAGDDGEAAPRRAVAARIEREDQRGALRAGVHGDHDVRSDGRLGEGNELFGHAAEHRARIGVAGRIGELADAGRRLDHVDAPHGLGEEGVFGIDVTEERGGSDAELAGDVGQGGGGESLGGEDVAGGLEDLIAPDARRAAHL